MFSILKSCTLSAADTNIHIDLSPLGVLPALCNLELIEGQFSSKMLPPNLLTLIIYDSTCKFHPVDLSLKDHAFPSERFATADHWREQAVLVLPAGIAACAGLQHLNCWSSTVCSNEAEHCLHAGPDRPFCMPAVVSALSCLTFLAIIHDGPSDGPIALSNMFMLKSLKYLRFISSSSSVTVGHGLTVLQHLEALRLVVKNEKAAGFGDVDDGADPYTELKLDVDWAALANLKHITIEADVFRCSANLLKLLNITTLRTVKFKGGHPGDASSSTSFAALADELARCLSVSLTLDTLKLPNHFAMDSESDSDSE